jgi:hypothetical protein
MRNIVTISLSMALSTVPAFAAEPPALLAAIQEHIGTGNVEAPKHRYALIDLNNDGIPDALVLLTAQDYCGSGGCTLEIYRGTGEGFEFLSGSALTSEPIRVSAETAGGWKTLIVSTRGNDRALLRFDGRRYPLNPSMQQRASDEQVQASTIVKTLPF